MGIPPHVEDPLGKGSFDVMLFEFVVNNEIDGTKQTVFSFYFSDGLLRPFVPVLKML